MNCVGVRGEYGSCVWGECGNCESVDVRGGRWGVCMWDMCGQIIMCVRRDNLTSLSDCNQLTNQIVTSCQ